MKMSVHCQYKCDNIINMPVQKLYRNGHSIAITIPKDFLDQSGWKIGDKVRIEYYPITKLISIYKPSKKSKYIDPEFFKAYERVLKEHGPALEELAKK